MQTYYIYWGGSPEEMTEILERKTQGKIIGGHNVQCDLNRNKIWTFLNYKELLYFQNFWICRYHERLTHDIAQKGIIDTQQLGRIQHSSKKHDPVKDARGSQQLAVKPTTI